MIIVSQDKDAILNFDNVIGIRTAVDVESKKEKLIAIDIIDGERYYIAKYTTEERAKEVLEEIIKTYTCGKILNMALQRGLALRNMKCQRSENR